MRRRSFFFVAGSAFAATAGWDLVSAQATPSNIRLREASGEELANNKETLLVDIRRPEEWNQTGVIEGALLITYDNAESFLKSVQPQLRAGQSLSLICRSGNRTSRAARQLAAAAPDLEIIDVTGGMLRVMREGYRTVRPQ